MLNACGIEVDQGNCLERRGVMEWVKYFYIIKSMSEQISRKKINTNSHSERKGHEYDSGQRSSKQQRRRCKLTG